MLRCDSRKSPKNTSAIKSSCSKAKRADVYFIIRRWHRRARMVGSTRCDYTGCIKKKVIELCSALARSLYNLQKSFFRRRKDQAFSFRLSSFLRNLKKDWANTNQMKIAGRNRIFSPLGVY